MLDLFGAEMPLAFRFLFAFVIVILFVGVIGYFSHWLLRRLTTPDVTLQTAQKIEKSISELVHTTYDHRNNTDDAAAKAQLVREIEDSLSELAHKQYDDHATNKTAGNYLLVEKLAKLAKLHADGSLTDEEFGALKAKLIAEAANSKSEEGYPDRDRREPRARQSAYVDAPDPNEWRLSAGNVSGPITANGSAAPVGRDVVAAMSESLNGLLLGGLTLSIYAALAVTALNKGLFLGIIGSVLAFVAWKSPRIRDVVGAVVLFVAAGFVISSSNVLMQLVLLLFGEHDNNIH